MLFTFANYEVRLIKQAARLPATAIGWLLLGFWALSALPVPNALLLAPVIATFPLMATIDARTQLLPDLLTIPLLIAGLALAPLAMGNATHLGSLLGALAGGGLFALLLVVFKKVTQKDGLGWGDVKLLAALGAWVGLLGLVPLLLAACLIALVYNYVTRTPRGTRLPFGPFLLVGGWLALFYQEAYWRLLLQPY